MAQTTLKLFKPNDPLFSADVKFSNIKHSKARINMLKNLSDEGWARITELYGSHNDDVNDGVKHDHKANFVAWLNYLKNSPTDKTVKVQSFTLSPKKYGLGRLFQPDYVKHSCITSKRVIANFVVSPYYDDEDIPNCHPNFQNQISNFFGLKCDNLELYATNRALVLSMPEMKECNFQKMDFMSVMYDSNYNKYPKYEDGRVKPQFMKDINDFLFKKFYPILFNEYKDFSGPYLAYKGIKNKKDKKEEDTNKEGGLASIIIQTIERGVALTMNEVLGNSVGCLVYDGDYTDKNISQEKKDRACQHVFEKTGFRISLVKKPVEDEEFYKLVKEHSNPDASPSWDFSKESIDDDIEDFCDHYSESIVSCGPKIWLRNKKGLWCSDKDLVNEIMNGWIGGKRDMNLYAGIKAYIVHSSFNERPDFEDLLRTSSIGYMAFANGLLNILTKQIFDFRHQDVSHVYVSSYNSHVYNNPSTEALNWIDKNLMSCYHTDEYNTNLEDRAKKLLVKEECLRFQINFLTGKGSKYFLCIDGERNSGKSTITDWNSACFDNCFGTFEASILVKNNKIMDNGRNLGIADFTEKKLMACGELPEDVVLSGSMIKTLTSGGDCKKITKMGTNGTSLPITAGMICLQNKIPNFDDNSVYETLLYNRMACYYSPERKPEEKELAFWRPGDIKIKEAYKHGFADFSKEDLKNAYISYLLDFVDHSKTEYPLLRSYAKSLQKLSPENDPLDLISEIYEFGPNYSDVIMSRDLLSSLKTFIPTMTYSSMRLYLEKLGGLRINNNKGSFYKNLRKKITLISIQENSD